jgi:SagB-type dehydrogenase family enzyme
MTAISLDDAFARRRTCRTFTGDPVPHETVRALIEAGQGRTDAHGNRTVPSAHQLHPLRLHVVASNIAGLDPGLFAVDPGTANLEQTIDGELGARLEDAAIDAQPWISRAAGAIVVCADFALMARAFADQPQFAERGARYTFIEAGAAAQNIHLKATAEGLGAVLVAGIRNEAVAGLLGLAPPVAPILLMCFGWPSGD